MTLTPASATTFAARLARTAVDGSASEWADGVVVLAALDGSEWLVLDGAARSYRPVGGTPVAGVRGWVWEPPRDSSVFFTVMASLHVDGRIRERATRHLAGHVGPVAIAAVAVRLLDHVPQVREAAATSLGAMLGRDTAEAALAVVLAGSERLQGPAALGTVEARLRELLGDGEYVEMLLASRVRDVRRRGFTCAHAWGVLDRDRLLRTVDTESDQLVLAWCSDWLLELGQPQDFTALLDARATLIRQVAVIRAPDASLSNARLLQFTLDRAPRVREAARWRARQRDLDLAGWFREQAHKAAGAAKAAALDGLLGIGDVGDLPVFLGALTDPLPRVRAAAIPGVAACASAQVVEHLVPLLLDPSPRVAATAARVLGRAGVGPGAAADAWASEQSWSRRGAWRLARASGGWDRVEADLRAACDSDPVLAGLGTAGVRNWLHIQAASTWQSLQDPQRNRIAAFLATWDAPSAEKRIVAFHAGIRPLPDGAPSSQSEVADPRRRWWRR